jgi:hypothetical protein
MVPSPLAPALVLLGLCVLLRLSTLLCLQEPLTLPHSSSSRLTYWLTSRAVPV